MSAVPTFSQIRAQVAAIPEKSRQGKAIGIRSSGRWSGGQTQSEGDHVYLIQQCDSALAMRIALRQRANECVTRILVTSLDDSDLSDDIKLRLAKRRLFQIDSWQIVRSLFGARAVDPRLTRYAWIADSLLECVPAEGYPPAHGGFLDSETVWPLLLRRTIGLTADIPDLTSLLKWCMDADGTSRLRRNDQHFQEGVIEWLCEKAGPVAEIVLRCVIRLENPDALPLGLLAGVVFHPAADGKLEKPAGKLEERFLGGRTPDSGMMLRWHTAATEVARGLRHTDPRGYRQILARADDILRDIGADAFAHLSDISPLGFDQRLSRLGQRLADLVGRQSWSMLDELQSSQETVRCHDQASREVRRLERVDMALRLLRWLGDQDRNVQQESKSFSEAANEHLRDGGYVDWARLSLRTGDPARELSEAYAQLFEVVTRVREQQAQQFAQLLTDWTAAGSQGDQIVPVESILEQIVAPLISEKPALVILIDGMSVAVCRELLADITSHEWTAICEPGRSFNRPGLATIPSVTEFSRTSLWCGKLRQGAADDERKGFAEHPALLPHCRSGNPPVLFHKVALQESNDAVFAGEVRDAIQSSHRKIVGVVVNAVDDHLLKGEQLDVRWSRDEIKVLPALLHEARVARRLVVIVSDHGHVLDCQATARPADGGERWRRAVGEPANDELLIKGQRVLTEGHRLLAPWSERVRYGIKKNGYHGGLTPQEMVVPIVVLSSTDDLPKGWHELTVETPTWWDHPTAVQPVGEQPIPQLKPTKPKPNSVLFDLEAEADASKSTERALSTTPEWVKRLVESPVFNDQRRLAGRGIPADDIVLKLLTAIDGHGGKMTVVALARTLMFPELRLPGLLAKMQRLLNVDGYAALSRDESSNTIELNRDLLLKQFDLV